MISLSKLDDSEGKDLSDDFAPTGAVKAVSEVRSEKFLDVVLRERGDNFVLKRQSNNIV